MPILNNLARAEGTFDTTVMYDTSSLAVEIPAIKVDKTSDADDGKWIGDVLTYTITISNLDTVHPATDVSFTDTIDISLASLVLTSVSVNNTPLVEGVGFAYDPLTGKLDIPDPDGTYSMPEVPIGGSYDVVFSVTKV